MILCTMALGSCDKFLDMTPTDSVSDKLVWSKPEYAEMAINDLYHIMSYMGQFDLGQSAAGLTEGMTDELKYGSTQLNTHMWFANEIAYAKDGLSASTAAFYLTSWSYFYDRMTSINQSLSNLKEYGASYPEGVATRLEAELRFWRGYVYFELVRRHKNVIIYREDMQSITKNKALSSEEEGWAIVKDDLRFAAQNLPETSDKGRLTCYAAWAMLSRAMLYAEDWEAARDAAKEVMDSGKYSLTAEYSDSYSKTPAQGNTEAILVYEYSKEGVTHNFDDYFCPGGDPGRVMGALGTPTQEMVESYEYAKGGVPDWSAWHSANGTTQTPPYDLLEPRFQATVLYNGADWKGRKIESFVGGNDGYIEWKSKPTVDGKTTTGYFLRKLVCESHDLSAYSRSTQPWVAIRYAEVLLNYAEACLKLSEDEAARNAINEVRTRVNLPKATQSSVALMKILRRERKVELAYEGHQWWDLRRWELSESQLTGYRVHGLRIDPVGVGQWRYTYVDCDGQDRYFPAKLYRIPLPQSELENNSEVSQFEEWR